jgi:hypothetical protein
MSRAFTNDLITLAVLLGGGYLIYTKTDWFQQGLDAIKGLVGEIKGGGGGSAGRTPSAPSGGGGGGSIDTSTTCAGTPLTRDTGNGREEWESKNVPWDAYEVTWCGTFSGDDLTFKLYGPSHSGSACCWCVIHVKENGQIVGGGEGPHPSSNCEHSGSSNGKSGKASCYKATIEPGPIQRGYALVNGQWELRMEYKGPCGCSKKSSTKTGNTLMVRNDGTANTKCASMQALAGRRPAANYTSAGQYSTSLFTNNRPYNSQSKISNVR